MLNVLCMMRLLIHAGSGVPRIVCEIDGFTMNYLDTLGKNKVCKNDTAIQGQFQC